MGWWKIGSRALPNTEFAQAIQAFGRHSKARAIYAPNTLAAYQSDLSRFAGFIETVTSRPARLADFSIPQIQAFLRAESAAGLHPRTVSRRLASLSAFNHFIKQPITDWQPISNLLQVGHFSKPAMLAAQGLQPAHLSALWNVMEQATHARARRDQALLALLLETGLPLYRMLALNLGDLRDDSRTLLLTQRTGITARLSLDGAVQPLRRYLKEGRPELNHQPDEPALWISQSGRRMTRQAAWQVLRLWGHRAGLPITLSPRLLSQTAAQRLADSGLPLQQLQLRLGHQSSLSTLARLRRISA